MKKDIHPKYGPAKVTCSCGNTFETGSTVSDIKVEICSECHPFFTGKQKLVDTAGRVEKFKQRMEKKKEDLVSKKVKRKKKKEEKEVKIKVEESVGADRDLPKKQKKKKASLKEEKKTAKPKKKK